ncbi:MAG: glutamate-5-semialdehyde dehydrogenase [Oscillospiraceae bacterium]|jgi:glutamate-5-semialdehyde dehydrogenase|nr:glutamate-5-semialdehyde dehydrogenase [Oscillospiraceae bacterium]
MNQIEQLGFSARAAARVLATASTSQKNRALEFIRAGLLENTDEILAANQLDIQNAEKDGMKKAFTDRLLLTRARIEGIAAAVAEVIALPDPIGEAISMANRPNGLTVANVRVPLGVIGIIFESRPNVTVDAAVLCLKSGNACILRGGKEAINSNIALSNVMRRALEKAGLPAGAVGLVTDATRQSADDMMTARGILDLLIPRGGGGLIDAVVAKAKVPVIETGKGNCHIYVDSAADLEMAVRLTQNAKCSRPSVCNACETLLVARPVADSFLKLLRPEMLSSGVELRADPEALEIIGDAAIPAQESDWQAEYDDLILAVKVVSGLGEAIEHIEKYSTHHSETIVTGDYSAARRFVNEVDSAAVYVNASTRFTDGGELGLGAEIGISTQKLHARGPMGLRELTSNKYIIYGDGQVR